ncbi:MAG: AGE family epimerase/isomerase [Victivallaceae bacterium]|nr:AGE family epimerase/isomerase [Victivallaceae bacterium]
MKREPEFRALLMRSIDTMIARFQKNGSAYLFLDTKFSASADRDFDSGDALFKRREYVYGWIQGRGLESLAEHAAWLEAAGDARRAGEVDHFLLQLGETLEDCRKKNGNRLYFAMRPDGSAITPLESENANFTDLFYAKGLYAAALRLGKAQWRTQAESMFRRVISDIRTGKFRTDQRLFDPKNQGGFVSGKFPQGPRMIALGGLARFGWDAQAAEFINETLTHHVNLGQWAQMERFDFVEALDREGRPWRDREGIFCDPGHALEWIGLTGKCLPLLRGKPEYAELLGRIDFTLPELFRHIFDLGFQPAGGIMKCFNLTSRTAQNSDMPWWSLPETIRAGEELLHFFPSRSRGIETRVQRAVDAFLDGFVAAGSRGFACQTRDVSGNVSDCIPAVPDIDPGYHTNLSVLDVFALSSGGSSDSPSSNGISVIRNFAQA